MFPFVGKKLSRGMEDIVAVFANTVYVIDSLGKATIIIAAWVLLHELFETVFVKLLIFHVEILVFLHVGLVFESKLTGGPVAVEVGGLLASKGAMGAGAVLAASKPEKSLALDGIVLAMVVEVHLDV